MRIRPETRRPSITCALSSGTMHTMPWRRWVASESRGDVACSFLPSILMSGASSGQICYLGLNSDELAIQRTALRCDLRTGFLGEPVPLLGSQLEKASCKGSSFPLVVGSSATFPIVRDGKKRRGVVAAVGLMGVGGCELLQVQIAN